MTLKQKKIIKQIEKVVRQEFPSENTGHDWFHADRVRNMAKRIALKEGGADIFIIEASALLHDIADWKFHKDEYAGSKKAYKILSGFKLNEQLIARICAIVDNISFKDASEKTPQLSKEGEIVQDADRLDALGSIGIARTFAYGGHTGIEIFNPDKKPQTHTSFEEYKKNKSATTVNHFYEKLLLLKDRMNTATAKKIAKSRHEFMELFLQNFYDEVMGKS